MVLAAAAEGAGGNEGMAGGGISATQSIAIVFRRLSVVLVRSNCFVLSV